jgi:hypothetical protein
MISSLPRRTLTAAAAIALTLVLASCGEDAETATPSCEAQDDLAAAIQSLEDVDVVQDGTDALRDAVEDVGVALEVVGDAERSELGDEAEAVRRAVDEVRTAVAASEGQSPSQIVSTVSSAITTLADTVGALGAALEAECD